MIQANYEEIEEKLNQIMIDFDLTPTEMCDTLTQYSEGINPKTPPTEGDSIITQFCI